MPVSFRRRTLVGWLLMVGLAADAQAQYSLQGPNNKRVICTDEEQVILFFLKSDGVPEGGFLVASELLGVATPEDPQFPALTAPADPGILAVSTNSLGIAAMKLDTAGVTPGTYTFRLYSINFTPPLFETELQVVVLPQGHPEKEARGGPINDLSDILGDLYNSYTVPSTCDALLRYITRLQTAPLGRRFTAGLRDAAIQELERLKARGISPIGDSDLFHTLRALDALFGDLLGNLDLPRQRIVLGAPLVYQPGIDTQLFGFTQPYSTSVLDGTIFELPQEGGVTHEKVFHTPDQTFDSSIEEFTSFGLAGFARGAFVAVGEFDPSNDGAEIVLGSHVDPPATIWAGAPASPDLPAQFGYSAGVIATEPLPVEYPQPPAWLLPFILHNPSGDPLGELSLLNPNEDGPDVRMRVQVLDQFGEPNGASIETLMPGEARTKSFGDFIDPPSEFFVGSMTVEVLDGRGLTDGLVFPAFRSLPGSGIDSLTSPMVVDEAAFVFDDGTKTEVARAGAAPQTLVVPLTPADLGHGLLVTTNHSQLASGATAVYRCTVFDAAGNVVVQPQEISIGPGVQHRMDVAGIEGFAMLEGISGFSPETVRSLFVASVEPTRLFLYYVLGTFSQPPGRLGFVRQPVGVRGSGPVALRTRLLVINTSGLAGQSRSLDLEFALRSGDLGPVVAKQERHLTPGEGFAFDVDEFFDPGEIAGGAFNAFLDIRGDGLRQGDLLVQAVATTAAPSNALRGQSVQSLNYLLPPAAFDFRSPSEGDRHLRFAHFTDGGDLTSSLLLINTEESHSANARLSLRDDAGEPLEVDLNGQPSNGEFELTVPAHGLRVVSTDGVGETVGGSLLVSSSENLAGVVRFQGGVGTAGMGVSPVAVSGFWTPVETDELAGLDTGIAIHNLSMNEAALELALLDSEGTSLATASANLPALGHLARFIGEFSWDPPVDLQLFRGLLQVTTDAPLGAAALQTRTGEFVTFPIIPLSAADQTGSSVTETAAGRAAGENLDESIHFAQFANGEGLSSTLVLINPDPADAADIRLRLFDDDGQPIALEINGEPVQGELLTMIPARGVRFLETDGQGPLSVGSAIVQSDKPLGGIVVFAGSVGVAAIPAAAGDLPKAFLTPAERNIEAGTNTGLALMNPASESASVNLELLSADGQLLAQGQVMVPGLGHQARFIDELPWDQSIDFSDFHGLIRVSSAEGIAATPIFTAPGQFATNPVIPIPPPEP